MRLASYKGPLLLLAWQIVPVSVFGEFAAPIASQIDLSVGGSWRPSVEEFDGGIRRDSAITSGVRQ